MPGQQVRKRPHLRCGEDAIAGWIRERLRSHAIWSRGWNQGMELHLGMDHPAAPGRDLGPSDLPFSRRGRVQDPSVCGESGRHDGSNVMSVERMQSLADPAGVFDGLAGCDILPTHAATMRLADR
jgi:hypothetical protein